MNDVKKCVKAMTVYCLLLAFAIFLNTGIIPLSFPTNRMSSIYLITLSICLILRYYLRAAGQTHLKTAMLHLYHMIFFMILLRGIKYSVFENVPVLGRYTWYLYYLPIIFIPTLLFFVSLYVYAKEEQQAKRKWNWVAFVSFLLVLLVLTNDLHGQVFRFHPDFANWDNDYSYAWGFYVVTVWEYLLYMTAIAALVAKSSITKIKHHAGILLVSFAIGLALMLLSITGKMPKLNGNDLIYFPEAFCFMAAAVLECCMQFGLIPTNESYQALIRMAWVERWTVRESLRNCLMDRCRNRRMACPVECPVEWVVPVCSPHLKHGRRYTHILKIPRFRIKKQFRPGKMKMLYW